MRGGNLLSGDPPAFRFAKNLPAVIMRFVSLESSDQRTNIDAATSVPALFK